jgi:hypothetical protein
VPAILLRAALGSSIASGAAPSGAAEADGRDEGAETTGGGAVFTEDGAIVAAEVAARSWRPSSLDEQAIPAPASMSPTPTILRLACIGAS